MTNDVHNCIANTAASWQSEATGIQDTLSACARDSQIRDGWVAGSGAGTGVQCEEVGSTGESQLFAHDIGLKVI